MSKSPEFYADFRSERIFMKKFAGKKLKPKNLFSGDLFF
jgi:hypothetical protein